MLVYQKIIDRSTLREGFQIPVEFHPLLEMSPGGLPTHGCMQTIKLLIDGKEYDALLKNQGFDRQKYADHSNVVQIRYTVNSPLAVRLREIFSATWEYVERVKALPENQGRKLTIRVPEEQQEYLTLNTTDLPNVFVVDYVTARQKVEAEDEVRQFNELDFETTFIPREDSSAGYAYSAAIRKIRRLDRSIGDSLKRLYDYRCQMTGERIGEAYGTAVVEAHHLVPFTQSMNNDSSNIIILSPTYHRIVHSAGADWLPEERAFHFPNGLTERVLLNRHL